MKDLFRKYILPIILAAILYPYIRTLRVRIVDSSLRPLKKGHLKSYIYAHYHEDIPVVALHHAYANTICTMASRSKDGELISRVLTLLGFKMVRGLGRRWSQRSTSSGKRRGCVFSKKISKTHCPRCCGFSGKMGVSKKLGSNVVSLSLFKDSDCVWRSHFRVNDCRTHSNGFGRFKAKSHFLFTLESFTHCR